MKSNKPITTEVKKSEVDRLKLQLKHLNVQLENQQKEIAHLRDARDELFTQLKRFHGVRAQIRSLLIEIYARLNTKIENIGKFKAAAKAPIFITDPLDRDIKRYVAEYDANAFSERFTIGSPLARLFSRSLKKLLEGCVGLLKVAVRILRLIKRGVKK